AAAAVVAWFALKETLSPAQIAGMTLILGGVLYAVWKPGTRHATSAAPGFWYGASAGMAAAVCQAISSVMARQAFLARPDLSPLYATTVRIAAAALAMVVIAKARSMDTRAVFAALRTPRVPSRLVAGT